MACIIQFRNKLKCRHCKWEIEEDRGYFCSICCGPIHFLCKDFLIPKTVELGVVKYHDGKEEQFEAYDDYQFDITQPVMEINWHIAHKWPKEECPMNIDPPDANFHCKECGKRCPFLMCPNGLRFCGDQCCFKFYARFKGPGRHWEL